MDEKTKQRIEEIRKRLEEYHKCPDGPHGFYYYYDCYRSEIIKDVEFLLNINSLMEQKILRLRLEASYLRKGVPFKKIKL